LIIDADTMNIELDVAHLAPRRIRYG